MGDDDEDEDAGRTRRRMVVAALFLAVCLGTSLFLLTARRDLAAGAFLITAGLVVVPAGLWSERLARRRPPAFFYAAGVAAVVLPFVRLGLGLEWSPWQDLASAYRVTSPVTPGGLAGRRKVVIVVPTGPFMVRPYDFPNASTAFGDDGALLAPAWPMSLVYDPLWVPVAALSSCRGSGLDSSRTTLRLAGSRHWVEVSDPEGEVRAWCRERELPEEPPQAP